MATFRVAAGALTAQTLPGITTIQELEQRAQTRMKSGQPDLALRDYEKAPTLNPDHFPSILAAAGLLEGSFQPDHALALIRRALQLDAANPAALAALARLAATPEERLSATRRLVTASKGLPARLARQQLVTLEALDGQTAYQPEVPNRSYALDLEDPLRDGPPGAELPILRIAAPNGATLNFLISTSTDGIWLRASAAKALGARRLGPAVYPWVDIRGLLAGELGLLVALPLGDLTLRNCPVFIRDVSKRFMYGADGIIGTGIFHDFTVEIDSAASQLRLTPDTPPASSHFVEGRRYGPFLLVPVELGRERSGYFALSSLASDVIFGRRAIPQELQRLSGGRPPFAVTGWTCSGPLDSVYDKAALRVGDATWRGRATTCPLRDLDHAAGFRVAGIIGLSFLRRYTVVIDNRSGRVGLLPPSAGNATAGRRRPLPESGVPLLR